MKKLITLENDKLLIEDELKNCLPFDLLIEKYEKNKNKSFFIPEESFFVNFDYTYSGDHKSSIIFFKKLENLNQFSVIEEDTLIKFILLISKNIFKFNITNDIYNFESVINNFKYFNEGGGFENILLPFTIKRNQKTPDLNSVFNFYKTFIIKNSESYILYEFEFYISEYNKTKISLNILNDNSYECHINHYYERKKQISFFNSSIEDIIKELDIELSEILFQTFCLKFSQLLDFKINLSNIEEAKKILKMVLY